MTLSLLVTFSDSITSIYGDPRFRLANEDPRSPDWTLMVTKVQLQDDGDYRCEMLSLSRELQMCCRNTVSFPN